MSNQQESSSLDIDHHSIPEERNNCDHISKKNDTINSNYRFRNHEGVHRQRPPSQRTSSPIRIVLLVALPLIFGAITFFSITTWSKDKNRIDYLTLYGREEPKKRTEYCEPETNSTNLKQPINAWSNIGYIITGGSTIGFGVHDAIIIKNAFYNNNNILRKNPNYRLISFCTDRNIAVHDDNLIIGINNIIRAPEASILIGLTWFCLGISSFLFHGSPIRTWQQFDVGFVCGSIAALAIWSICSFCLWIIRAIEVVKTCCLHQRRHQQKQWKYTAVIMVLTRIAFTLLLLISVTFLVIYKWKYSSKKAMLNLVLVLLCVEAFKILMDLLLSVIVRRGRCYSLLLHPTKTSITKRVLWNVTSIILFVIALILRQLESDKKWWNRPLCLYSSWFQPHSLWHLLTSMSLFCAYLAFRDVFDDVVVVRDEDVNNGEENDVEALPGG